MDSKVIPKLTIEQRREAAAKSLQLRRDRAALKRWIAEGLVPLSEAWTHDWTQGMKVYDLLVSLPGVGHRTAAKLLKTAGIPEKNTVRGCGPRQTERLFAALAQRTRTRQKSPPSV